MIYIMYYVCEMYYDEIVFRETWLYSVKELRIT